MSLRAPLPRRAFLAAGAFATILPEWARADDFPSHPLRVVVPYPPGGAADIVARTMGDQLAHALGKPVVVDNKPGAAGSLAATFVAKAPPDGYTLLVADFGQLAINPTLRPKITYNPSRDFMPLSPVATVPLFLAVRTDMPFNTVGEMIEYARKQPRFAYSTPGVGSPHHLAMEMLNDRTGLRMMHVPYTGGGPAILAAISGDVNVVISALGALTPQVRDNKLKLIGVCTKERSRLAPNVPTVAEAVPGFNVFDMIGLFLPVGSPRAVADRLTSEIMAIGRTPEFTKRLADLGLDATVEPPDAYSAQIAEASKLMGKLVTDLGLTAE